MTNTSVLNFTWMLTHTHSNMLWSYTQPHVPPIQLRTAPDFHSNMSDNRHIQSIHDIVVDTYEDMAHTHSHMINRHRFRHNRLHFKSQLDLSIAWFIHGFGRRCIRHWSVCIAQVQQWRISVLLRQSCPSTSMTKQSRRPHVTRVIRKLWLMRYGRRDLWRM